MDEKKYSLDEIMGMTASRSLLEIFKSACEVNQVTALTSAVSFFTQVLFLMPDEGRAKLMMIIDEISILMNGNKSPDDFLKELTDFDLKSRMESLAL